MAKATYNGQETATYLHYLDLSTGKTLIANKGETYDVSPAGGNLLSVGTDFPQDGKWVAVEDKDEKEEKPSKKGHVTIGDTMPTVKE